MLRSTAWATALFLAASPAFAQTSARSSEGISVAYAGVAAGIPGIAVISPSVRDLGVRLPLAIDIPGPAMPLSYLDFGGYEPYVPRLARRVLPDTPNNTDPFQLTLSGTPTSTAVGAKVQAKSGNVAVQARATNTIPGLPVLGDRASKWRPAPDLKVDVRYAF